MIVNEPIRIEIDETIKKFLMSNYNLIVFGEDHKSQMCFGEFYFYQNHSGDTYIAPPFHSVNNILLEFLEEEGLYEDYKEKLKSYLDRKEKEAVKKFRNQDI